ncbi:uncharacterized protein LOC114272882 isoform X1 [Camellia sinensis]|uniref:uncharacterized protein LOC114272882 isoform X1 n=1 Tax=Camellia sinensis TaxID=4442 RepID=UPI001035F2E3|nr:uncharacterized protein LOC114272882 isoform X1 [Camellia sinensis]XP_028070386.1 uncharacterized protein LOC114272882 isoform X1 [Camellia sinensis]XP_028070387.1 uncharacterized protein LOC114272882 isoform X1 [Camellia sinensis]XP_028070388.1 uncharacterized protein LOC114272882 isoform X1 [Camellia sinensis]XP_028070390.1 uncharacterized protein LOC114272882 isoform X1 [Camellia sinensis]XP_028070391.1 uncharacterized protein LOC114272882 isoform X1 [Camellia sinensis]XP_028070392.1 un
MYIGDNWFRIPYTYSFPFCLGGRIQMIIGCNFIRAMYGGVRIEGDNVTFYKNVITIQTRQTVNLLEGLEEEEDFSIDHYYDPSTEWIFHSEKISPGFEQKFSATMEKLKNYGIIGDDPMKYWSRNQITCKLDLKNPDFTINDRPMKHVTPSMKESFSKHIEQLLQLKVIRASKSRHRTTAFIVNSGTYIDHVTKEEKRGKERMVCNYKRLNDNTHKDQYSLPGINTIMAKIGHSNIYSKFDLKSGSPNRKLKFPPGRFRDTAVVGCCGCIRLIGGRIIQFRPRRISVETCSPGIAFTPRDVRILTRESTCKNPSIVNATYVEKKDIMHEIARRRISFACGTFWSSVLR